MSGGERAFTFPGLERLTPDLSPAERLAVFLGLPVDLQAEAWRELGARIEAQSRARFAEYRLGDSCTPQELADEIALLWGECRKVPLAGVGEQATRPPARSDARRLRASVADGDLEQLRSISSSEFVPALTGREVNRGGYVRCPLPRHADGEERTPSLHVSADDARWYCHGCGAGGDLFAFYAALRGESVPVGREFVAFVGEVAAALLGAWG